MLKGFNSMFIGLIPKKKGTNVFDDFRPVSLRNMVYKIMSKIIATQMRKVIDKLISPIQSIFYPG